MADERPSSAPPGSQQDTPRLVNLQIVSPSVGVGNLRFPDLPADTTVQQLKNKIRDSLPSRPADDHQRLIHRGRLLARDADTLHHVFGEEAIRANDQQTIHLVLRDMGDHPPPADPVQRPETHIRHHLQHPLRNAPAAAMPRPGSAPIGLAPATAQPNLPHLPQLLQQQREMAQRITHLHHQEANYRHLLAQQQQLNQRAAMAHHTSQDGTNNAQGNMADPTGGRSSPVGQAFRTVTREGTGPDGQRYSFRITLNESIAPPGAIPGHPGAPGPTSDPVGQRPLSAADVRNVMHGADATRAAQVMANAMQRNALGAHPANMPAELAHFNFNSPIQPIQPGVTTPIFPGLSRNASRAATPDISTRSVSHGSGSGSSSQQPHPQASHGQPEVYILSSPTGPRALLINGSSEMYTTPTARPLPAMPNYYRPLAQPSLLAEPHRPAVQIHQGQGTVHMPPPHTQPYRPPSPLGAQQQPLPQAQQQHQPAIRRRPVGAPAGPAAPAAEQPAPQLNHPGNPGMAPVVAAAWPHVWLAIRLVLFAWWFSYTDPSWERWLSLVVAFVVVLAINTGIFNGMVNNAFHPVREQLEGMIPFADPNRPQQQGGQQNQGEGVRANQDGASGANPNPDPAQTAARLVAQRRAQNGGWLRDQLRRIERAGILFLASFAPGVAERHIQQLEEQERADRRAAEEARAAAEAAAAAAREQAEQAAAAENQEGQEGQRVEGQDGASDRQPQAPEIQPQPPLVEV